MVPGSLFGTCGARLAAWHAWCQACCLARLGIQRKLKKKEKGIATLTPEIAKPMYRIASQIEDQRKAETEDQIASYV